MIELLWNAPVSEAKMSVVIESLDLSRDMRVVDFGCGCGEVLIRIVRRYQVDGVGIDSSEQHIDEARRRTSLNAPEGRTQFNVADASTYQVNVNSLDLAICMGSTHAFGLGTNAYENAIRSMMASVVSGGLLLVADGYMKQPASPEYRKILGETMADDTTHEANVAVGKELGLVPLGAWTSSDDEWDEFEWSYQRIVEQAAATNRDNEEVATKLAHRREWMDAYLKWGRNTLGYGIYLFRKP